MKNPKLNKPERKVLQDGLDKVNRYIKKIEDLFSTYGGINKMSINNTIGEIYNLPAPYLNSEYSLELWYIEFYNKQIEDISISDVVRMLEQEILEDLAISKAIEYLYENPLVGEMYDGQLMEALLSIEINKFNDSIEGVKKMISEVSLKLNELVWASTEDREEYSDLLKGFQERITGNK